LKVYAGMDPRLPLADTAAHVRRVEGLGYDGLHVAETVHDALAVSLLALEHSKRLIVRTAVSLAFPRSPTLTAYAAWDLAGFSGGRFELGLGTQIRQNIEERYGMPWSEPVAQMRDYLEALRDLFECFRTGASLDHRGPRYRLTRLQPYFNPGPDPAAVPPRLFVGGVNRSICELAGETADGFITHPTNSTPEYLTELCLPALHAGAARAGREPDAIELVVSTQAITGPDEQALVVERERQRALLGFLYSTPAYRRTLELYGWEHVATELATLARNQRWDDMAPLVSDVMLDTLVPCATYAELPGVLHDRYGDVAQGIVLSPPADPAQDDAFATVVRTLRST